MMWPFVALCHPRLPLHSVTVRIYMQVGVAMLFNPTMEALEATVLLPLYYCGLDVAADVAVDGGAATLVSSSCS